jgi:hypothetical protein
MMLAVSAHVRWTVLEERAILLCLQSGRYLGLDPVATLMWQGLVAAHTTAQICAEIAQRYQVPLADVAADYAALLARLRARGLVTASPVVGERPPRALRSRPWWHGARLPRPRWMQAWYSLLAVSATLRYGGFATGYQYAARCSHQCRRDTQRLTVRVSQALASFSRAENVFLARRGLDDCLARSLSLFVFFRHLGLPAHHHIGVRGHPFTAHAWVTVEDAPLLEPPEGMQRFTVLACLS